MKIKIIQVKDSLEIAIESKFPIHKNLYKYLILYMWKIVSCKKLQI